MSRPRKSKRKPQRARESLLRRALDKRDGGRLRGRCSLGFRFLEATDVRLAPACPRVSPRCWEERDVWGDRWWTGETGTSNSEEWCGWALGARGCSGAAPAPLPEIWCWPWPAMRRAYLDALEDDDAQWERFEALYSLASECESEESIWFGWMAEARDHEDALIWPASPRHAAHRLETEARGTGRMWRIEPCTMRQPEAVWGCPTLSPRGRQGRFLSCSLAR